MQPSVKAPAVSAPGPGSQHQQQAGTSQTSEPVLVLGIGNVLWADEGFGVRCVEALDAAYAWPEHVRLVDGGTQGMYLLEYVCAASRVLVFDAIDYKLPPATLKVLRDREVPEWTDTAMSLHQATFQELLSLARLQGRFPKQITLVGVQPVQLEDLGGSLSPEVRARIDEALALSVAELAAWGVVGTPRTPDIEHLPPMQLVTGALAMPLYEAERPSAEAACRVGDDRFLNPPASEPPAQASQQAGSASAAGAC